MSKQANGVSIGSDSLRVLSAKVPASSDASKMVGSCKITQPHRVDTLRSFMRLFLALISIVMIFGLGCAHAIPYTYKEHCAHKDMKVAGVDSSYGSGTVSTYYRGSEMNSSIHTENENISCVAPENKTDRCEIERQKEIAWPKDEYNESIGTKRFLTGAGYCLYIVPGVIAKVYFDSRRSAAIGRSHQIENESRTKCEIAESN